MSTRGQKSHSFLCLWRTGSETGDAGAQELSKALRTNTTLTKLNIQGMIWLLCFFFHPLLVGSLFGAISGSGGNNFGEAGSKALSEALLMNTTLQTLVLPCKLSCGLVHKCDDETDLHSNTEQIPQAKTVRFLHWKKP